MTKLATRVLLALATALVISCGGGGGGIGATPGAVSGSINHTGAEPAAPEWGFANQISVDKGGADAGASGSGAGSAAGAGSGSGGAASASASAGDSSGVGSGGTGASASAGDSGDSGVGGVGGVASIIVNGVRYDTTGAILKLRDAAQLQLGMTAKVNGPTNADFTAGQATEVESAADALGVITSIDLAGGNLAIVGATIGTDTSTVWGNLPGLSALVPGMTVQVWGLPAGPGLLRATRIEQRATTGSIVSGTVQNLDLSGRRFQLGNLTVDFSQTSLPSGLAAGMIVRVRAPVQSASAPLRASAVELWYPVSLREGTRRQLGGVVTDFEGISRFRVLRTPVDASAAQVTGGPSSAVSDGVELEVAGTIRNGILVATRVKIKKTVGGKNTATFTAAGTVGAFKSIAEFKVKGQSIDASAVGIELTNGVLASLGNGSKVTITGERIVNDVLIATRVTFD